MAEQSGVRSLSAQSVPWGTELATAIDSHVSPSFTVYVFPEAQPASTEIVLGGSG
jgi:hypothetical protein